MGELFCRSAADACSGSVAGAGVEAGEVSNCGVATVEELGEWRSDMSSGRPSTEDDTAAAAAAPAAALFAFDGAFFLVRMILLFLPVRALGVGLLSFPIAVSFLINAGLGTVPKGSMVSSTPCLTRPCSWKLGSRTRSGSIQFSMNRLDLSVDEARPAGPAATVLLLLPLTLSLSVPFPRLLPSFLTPAAPRPPPPTAGLEYRERVARVVGGGDMVSRGPGQAESRLGCRAGVPLVFLRAASWQYLGDDARRSRQKTCRWDQYAWYKFEVIASTHSFACSIDPLRQGAGQRVCGVLVYVGAAHPSEVVGRV